MCFFDEMNKLKESLADIKRAKEKKVVDLAIILSFLGSLSLMTLGSMYFKPTLILLGCLAGFGLFALSLVVAMWFVNSD